MKVSGYRERGLLQITFRYMDQFRKVTNVDYTLEDVTADSMYLWLNSMDVSNQTKANKDEMFKGYI